MQILFSTLLRFIAFIFCLVLLSLFLPAKTLAITDPLVSENNKFGIHIFDPSEIDKVSDLVNSNGGEWGYVTVPVRADDRNREKWNAFMKKCSDKKLIPLIRLATTMTPKGWAKPSQYDDIDFANFLNDLDWPTQNRYIIVYNEPNHATEWGGEVNPEEYVQVLEKTTQTFKDRNENFFILPAGLDAAAPNKSGYMNWKTFLMRMYAENHNALSSIDGWTSHSYPNPAFSRSPYDRHDHSITSFKHEADLVKRLTGKTLPVFITETGWSNEHLSDRTIANYYEVAFSSAWADDQIVAITPFVLHAGNGPFTVFSLLHPDGSPKPQYETLKNLPKTKGQPLPNVEEPEVETVLPVLGEVTEATPPSKPLFDINTLNKLSDVFNWFKN